MVVSDDPAKEDNEDKKSKPESDSNEKDDSSKN